MFPTIVFLKGNKEHPIGLSIMVNEIGHLTLFQSFHFVGQQLAHVTRLTCFYCLLFSFLFILEYLKINQTASLLIYNQEDDCRDIFSPTQIKPIITHEEYQLTPIMYSGTQLKPISEHYARHKTGQIKIENSQKLCALNTQNEDVIHPPCEWLIMEVLVEIFIITELKISRASFAAILSNLGSQVTSTPFESFGTAGPLPFTCTGTRLESGTRNNKAAVVMTGLLWIA